MAKKITAIRRYRPEIRLQRTVQISQMVRWIKHGTNLTEGGLRSAIYTLRDFILETHRAGQPVKIDGLGTFTPTIRMDGELDILFRPDPAMLRSLNDRTQFSAKIVNRANIGKTAADLVAQWNKAHPEDPVEE